MLGGILTGLLFNALHSPKGPQDLLVLRHRRAALTAKRDLAEADNARLREEISRLKSDDVYLQSLIRQQLGYVRPGDRVYRFPPADQ